MATKCKRRARKGYQARYERYKTYGRKEKNKELKAIRHRKKVDRQKIASTTRNKVLSELVEMCNVEFRLGRTPSKAKYLLKRVVGTLSKKKLELLLNGNIRETEWFRCRRLTPSLIDMLSSTSFPQSLCELMVEVKS